MGGPSSNITAGETKRLVMTLTQQQKGREKGAGKGVWRKGAVPALTKDGLYGH